MYNYGGMVPAVYEYVVVVYSLYRSLYIITMATDDIDQQG